MIRGSSPSALLDRYASRDAAIGGAQIRAGDFCIGATLARAETHAALDALLALPRLRLDPARPAAPRGLIFRKPPALHVTWDP